MPLFYHNWQNERVTTNSDFSVFNPCTSHNSLCQRLAHRRRSVGFCVIIYSLSTWPLIVLYLNTTAIHEMPSFAKPEREAPRTYCKYYESLVLVLLVLLMVAQPVLISGVILILIVMTTNYAPYLPMLLLLPPKLLPL